MQVETDEDMTTLEELRALTRVFVPEKVQEDFVEVRGTAEDCVWPAGGGRCRGRGRGGRRM